MTGNEEIASLISRVALHDRNAFAELYRRTSAKLFGICLRILNNRTEAEDALQDVYVKIWRNAGGFGPSEYSPISWLVAIARNHAIDMIRARKPVALDIDDIQEEIPSGINPEQAVIATSQRLSINKCLGELDEVKAGAVRGAYLDGLSYEQLSARHGIPLNTMRTWLRRSLLRLKDCLER